MSRYLQTSTGNPYGHRPWATRLYTGFENYAFLKQPQNTIIREDVNMRPEIYRPPELKAGLGDATLVGGSGRILRRGRRGTLGAVMIGNGAARGNILDLVFRRTVPVPPVSQIRVVGPISTGPVFPAPMPKWTPLPPTFEPICEHAAPPDNCTYIAAASAANPCGVTMKCQPPITILPPPMVPPVPRPVAKDPSGTVYALPGDATTPGSPFAPPSPGQLGPAGAVPISPAAPAVSASSLADWFNAQSLISGVPNGYVAVGGALALYMFSKKKR